MGARDSSCDIFERDTAVYSFRMETRLNVVTRQRLSTVAIFEWGKLFIDLEYNKSYPTRWLLSNALLRSLLSSFYSLI